MKYVRHMYDELRHKALDRELPDRFRRKFLSLRARAGEQACSLDNPGTPRRC
jgi:hypothetical protein